MNKKQIKKRIKYINKKLDCVLDEIRIDNIKRSIVKSYYLEPNLLIKIEQEITKKIRENNGDVLLYKLEIQSLQYMLLRESGNPRWFSGFYKI